METLTAEVHSFNEKKRNASHPREFLKDYSGICVTDGYQVYHTVKKELEDLTIAVRLLPRVSSPNLPENIKNNLQQTAKAA